VKVYAFLDLDDTLFQTLPKCPPGEACRAAAFRKDGAALSYMTRRQERLFEVLGSIGTIIPVTARNLDSFRRVDLPFTSMAILDFGGVVLLPGGQPDPDWDARVRPQALAVGAALERLVGSVIDFVERKKLAARARVIHDFDMPLYAVMKHPDGDVRTLERIAAEHLPTQPLDDFCVHANGNNLSIVPRFLGKEHAVAYLLERHVAGRDALSVGIGDSVSDVPFLRLCDFLMTPRGSQLAAMLERL
jgi:hypothetical protein